MNLGQSGNLFSAAQELNVTNTPQVYTDNLTDLKPNIFYRINLTSSSNVSLNLDGLTNDVNIQLFDREGKVINSSTRKGTFADFISRVLDKGTYFFRIFAPEIAGSTDLQDRRLLEREQYSQSNSAESANSFSGNRPINFKLNFSSTPVDSAGNTTATARAVTLSTSNTNISDWVGNVDANDYYRFSLNADSNFSFRMSGLTGNADAQLLSSSGSVIQLANSSGTTEEIINRHLTKGDYFIRVFPNSDVSTNYKLTMTASPDAGNTLTTARVIGNVGTSNIGFKDWLGTVGNITDNNDFYRFSLTSESYLNLKINGLKADANLQLLDSNGAIITSSSETGTRDENIRRQLAAGNYFVRVFPNAGVTTNYNLNISATPDAGNSLTTAKAMTVGTSNTRFIDWVGVTSDNSIRDTDDFYRFNLTNSSQLNLSLSGLSGNADVQLLDNAGKLIQASTNSGTNGETIARQLDAGNYFIRVVPVLSTTNVWSNTEYTLNISATPTDFAGNTINTARELNFTGNNTSLREWLGTSDQKDLYRFTLANNSNFNLVLSNLTADANVRLLDSSGSQVITSSNNSGSTVESIARELNAGTYFIELFTNGSNINTFYNLDVAVAEVRTDWIGQNLRNIGISNLVRNLAADGQLNRNDMMSILRDTTDNNVVDTTEIKDLQTILKNANGFKIEDHVRVLTNKIVNGDTANNNFQGKTLGNLVTGSSATHMQNLISKWFLGSDRPKASSSYRYTEGSLFQNGIHFNDIVQGNLGDCYFLSSIASVAQEKPQFIEQMFIDNKDGTFTVRFYKNNVADYVTVDRFLPVDGSGKLVYASKGRLASDVNNELWVALAEKAYAQINESGWILQDGTNSYAGIDGGFMSFPIQHITKLSTSVRDVAFITRQELVDVVNSNKIVTAGFYEGGNGVVSDHAYTVTSYTQSSDSFSFFNPWGYQHAQLNWQQVSNMDVVFIWSNS